MAAQVKELTKGGEGLEEKISKGETKYNAIQRELDDIRKDNQKLSKKKIYYRSVSDRYDRVNACSWNRNCRYSSTADIQTRKSWKKSDGWNKCRREIFMKDWHGE